MVQGRKAMKNQQRSQIWLEEARRHNTNLKKIAAAYSGDKETFFKLIKENKAQSRQSTTELLINDTSLTTAAEICQGWAKHFGDLAIPQERAEFDADYKEEVGADLIQIEKIIAVDESTKPTIAIEKMNKAIESINKRIAPDADGITIEHIKNAWVIMVGALTQ